MKVIFLSKFFALIFSERTGEHFSVRIIRQMNPLYRNETKLSWAAL